MKRARGAGLTGAALVCALAAGTVGATPAAAAPATVIPAPHPTAVSVVEAGARAAVPPRNPAKIRAAIVKAALSQVGKREAATNNYPKAYRYNNTIVRPAEWCGVFVNWAWWKGGATARPLMKHPSKGWNTTDQGHYATYWQKWAKSKKRWQPISKGRVAKGDAVVYGTYPASIAHIGLVVDVKKNRNGKVTHVRTVEGNVQDKVYDYQRKWRSLKTLSARGKKATGFVSPVAI